jgi:hypothetical protein
VQGWAAEVMRHSRRDIPHSYIDVITATSPGPSVLEVLGSAAHDGNTRADQQAVDAAWRAAATRGAEFPDPDELKAAGLVPIGMRVLVEDAPADFTGLRGTDLWCCGTVMAEVAIWIAGVRWDTVVPELIRIENPGYREGAHVHEIPDGERLRQHWDEIAREEEPAAAWAGGTGAILVDQPERLIVALHVRDAGQLKVHPEHPIPPLTPPVPPLAFADEAWQAEASSQWPSWWRRLASSLGRPPAPSAARLAELADGPALDELIRRDLDSALTWARQRKQEFMADRRRQPEQEITQHHVADLVGDRVIRISVLPLRGQFGTALGHRHLLASHELRSDPDAYSAWLGQALRQLS